MKRKIFLCIAAVCLLLSGCTNRTPEKAADGTPWDQSWTTLGDIMGVDTMTGWTVQRNEDVLAAEGLYYVVWASGSSVSYTGADGSSINAHEAEIHLIAQACKTEQKARENADSWKQLTDERYPENVQSAAEYAGQAFDICSYALSDPAGRGASATGIRGSNAIRAEVVVLDSDSRDPVQILADFLTHCHYAA